MQIVNADWGPLVAGQLKDFDFALSEIAITDEHRTAADFSVPYFDLDVGVLVKKATAIDEHSIKTMRVGVLQNSAAAAVVTAALKLKSMNSFAEEGELFTALRSGQIDAAIADMPIVLTEELQETGVLEVAGQYKSGRVYGALYPKGSTNAAAFNSTITALQVDGTLKRLAGKYFTPVWGKDPATVPYFNP